MARPPLAGAISARARPFVISGMWRSRQKDGRAFRYLRDLISVLLTVAPQVLEDPRFLDRCLVLDGVPVSVSPSDLHEGILGVQTAVLVRDSQTGFRIALLVFSDSLDSTALRIQPPREGLYATCTPATRHYEVVIRSYILDGVGDECARRCMGRVLRSLLPPLYIHADKDQELHLRCVLIGAGRDPLSGGAYGLCDLAWKVLAVRGSVVATIVSSDRQVGVLVYDDTESTELVARRAPQLLHKMGLKLYDTSLFPLPADPAADRGDISLLQRLLPECVTDDEDRYRRRVLQFSGLDTQKLDAADFAHFMQSEADLIHTVEAVIIHRSEGLAFVVLGSSDDTLRLLYTPEETWVRFFGQKPSWASVFGFGRPYCEPVAAASLDSSISSEQQSVVMGAWAAFNRVKDWIQDESLKLRDGVGIIRSLIRTCALDDPDYVQSDGFPERGLLLSGVVHGTSSFDLEDRLCAFGELYDVAIDIKEWKALAVFKYRHGAARLLRQPQDTWAGLGFLECSRVPHAEHAGVIAQEVVDMYQRWYTWYNLR